MSAEETDAERLGRQLYFIERAVRGMRAEIERTHAAAAIGPCGARTRRTVEIATPLGRLLGGPSALREVALKPYEHMADDLWCAFTRPAESVVANTISYAPIDPDAGSGSSCLVLTPDLPASGRSDWLTLEMALDPDALEGLARLRIAVVLSCRGAGERKPGNFAISLRRRKGDAQEDFFHHSFPMLDMPIEYAMTLERGRLAALPAERADALVLMIWLPTDIATPHDFVFSHFAVTAEAFEG